MHAIAPGERAEAHAAYAARAPLSRRLVALAFAIGFNVLLILMLLGLAPSLSGLPVKQGKLTTIDLMPDAAEEPAKTRSAQPKKAAARAAPKAAAARAPAPPPPSETPPVEAVGPLKMIIVSRDDFAAADIGRVPRAAPGPPAAAPGEASADSDAGGGARGPHGEKLYDAAWYRRPTHAEIAGYVQNGAPAGSWAVIACRTVPDFRVEDCVELGESPAGSRLAGKIRQAAWQFRVRPPRVGGKSLVGEWVRIRIDFTERGDRDGGGGR